MKTLMEALLIGTRASGEYLAEKSPFLWWCVLISLAFACALSFMGFAALLACAVSAP